MSSQPRADSSSASAAPTTPAPMMTTRDPATPASRDALYETRRKLRNNHNRHPSHLSICRRVGGALPTSALAGAGEPLRDEVGVGVEELLRRVVVGQLVHRDRARHVVLLLVGPGEVRH